MKKSLSDSTSSHKLAEIQERCRKLMDSPDDLNELTLDGVDDTPCPGDPYNQYQDPHDSYR